MTAEIPGSTPEKAEAQLPLSPKVMVLREGQLILIDRDAVANDEKLCVSFPEEPEARWRDETLEPAVRIDYFFEDNKQVFQHSAEAWKQIRNDQQQLSEIPLLPVTLNESRQARRQREKTENMYNRNVVMGIPKNKGHDYYTKLNGLMADRANTPFAARMAMVDPLYEYAVMPEMRNMIRNFPHRSPTMELVCTDTSRNYVKAFMARDEVLACTNELLADQRVGPVFMARVQHMAEDMTIDEYPGFLEIIATHVLQEGETKNMLYAAMEHHVVPAAAYAGDFFTAQLEGTTNYKGKETGAFISGVRLAGLVLDKEGVDDDELAARMSKHVDKWPAEMQTGLQAYGRDQARKKWLELRSSLEPYMREGRLPAVKGAQINGRRAGKMSAAKLTVSSKTQDHESVVASTEISSLAIFGRAAAKGVFELVDVDSLDELFEQSNLAEYAKKHQGDKSLEPLFRAALGHLITPPYDKTRVSKLQEVTYRLESDAPNRRRKPSRLKLQGTPDLAKGPIADATRIIFDVVRGKDGQPTLAIYGAFIKQLIHGMGELPSRR